MTTKIRIPGSGTTAEVEPAPAGARCEGDRRCYQDAVYRVRYQSIDGAWVAGFCPRHLPENLEAAVRGQEAKNDG